MVDFGCTRTSIRVPDIHGRWAAQQVILNTKHHWYGGFGRGGEAEDLCNNLQACVMGGTIVIGCEFVYCYAFQRIFYIQGEIKSRRRGRCQFVDCIKEELFPCDCHIIRRGAKSPEYVAALLDQRIVGLVGDFPS